MRDAHSVRATTGGRELIFETGAIACLAHGSVVARQGDAVVLAAVVASHDPPGERDFFPLTVEYREKLASAGRIPGGYLRRESRATEAETLAARFVDRSIRPLFPEGFLNETQATITVLSYDPDVDPGVLAINAASAALRCSGIPWDGPVAAVRVAQAGETLTAAPTAAERADASLDLLVSFTCAGLVMAEGRMDQHGEERIVEVIGFARGHVTPILQAQDELRSLAGVPARDFVPEPIPCEVVAAVEGQLFPLLGALIGASSKQERRKVVESATRRVRAALASLAPESMLDRAMSLALRRHLRDAVLRGMRLDGRRLDEVRPISAVTGWLPRAHGSAVFTRGETQAVVTCTLGTGREELEMETLDGPVRRPFMLHYNFPPYSVGEIKPSRGPGRRELGHGNLARAALEPVLPPAAEFPYTIRVESDITQSNGSSSMATVCGGSLALMDAGVPISAPVAGVAMGLVLEGPSHTVLTDIMGDEDHAGDMDFKVAGTRKGVTAIQLDNKLGAVPENLLAGALAQAQAARLDILDAMDRARSEPRTGPRDGVPRVEMVRIRPNRIRELIGPSGKTIQDIQTGTGARVEVDRDGTVRVYADSQPKIARAVGRIRELTGFAEVGG
ncbi:MAG: polyribonucleotide nucleotidyltransferase, partial [Candidatus Eisenbacteria bacterium]|nr:polyribonucleotide nucleotidyltransferase [Candidatus Eisenbacteria bacterium]